MKPAPSLPPSREAVNELLTAAARHLDRMDYPAAIQNLERAQRMDPDNYRIPLDLGYAHALAYDFEAARQNFERAVALAPNKTGALMLITDRWSDVRQFDAARKAGEAAMAQSPAPPGAFFQLGKIYLRQRQLDRAQELAERAAREHPEHESVLLIRGKIFREAGRWPEAEASLHKLLANSNATGEARATALYELGIGLDREQRYDEAMAAFVEAKNLMRRAADPVRRILRAKQTTMKETQTGLTASLVENWRKIGESDLQPNRKVAVLCGHARSGTTLLEYVLDAHPQIISADETAVFQGKAYPVISRSRSSRDTVISALEGIAPRIIRQARAEYFRGIEACIGETIGERLLLDKNPALTADMAALCRFLPEAKIFVALRDPRDVCLSCFMQAAPLVPDTVPWLDLGDTVRHYVALHELWQAVKPCLGGGALEVKYEEVVADLPGAARRALDFLGLPWDEKVLSFHEHAQGRTVGSPTYAEVTRPVYKSAVGRWRNYQKYFEPHLAQLEPVLRTLGYE